MRETPQKDVNGLQARKTIRIKSLAEFIRSEMHPKDFYEWLRAVAKGIDPDAEEGTWSGPIDFKYRMKAMQMLIERAYGAVPQHITLEAETTSLIGMSEAIPELSEEKLRVLRDTVRGLLEGHVVDVKGK